MIIRTSIARGWADLLAVGASAACLIHCLFLPVVVAFAPALTTLLSLPEAFHLIAFLFAVPVSGWAMARGYRLHGAAQPALVGAIGLGALGLGSLAGSSWLVETGCTIAGSILLAFAHLRNWRLNNERLSRALSREADLNAAPRA
ncbi:MerC domain-containing protein [Sphingosinicella terrae]|uniref:MerC domain-containing protein n=1 Tax=Sphingosinicella terrae TaxID=2172047 RepID=UPI0013B3E701|nr:MerC domain-containing protein [Sphingosinicella terrae]